ncbi:carbon-nitrogen hydrolase family protein [Nocardioides sp. B-3]|uniref:carbon-nitrogen hydrolase family protein n=1 Tax=Nocardioides sp. B-3 TaxID=2895565 RepID=UPI002152FF9E|nr:nitrilase-related carbon-nitrogen hydrolase [Nocardioides sp. B-3]UUZ59487.1 hypothetical protein LP418_27550 [Nocardioides sp. B-3]
MSRTLRVGLTQWHATGDVEANLATAVDLVRQAASAGAELVVLPENGLMLGTNTAMRERALLESGPEIGSLRAAAAEHGVVVVLGGMKNATAEGVFNSALVIRPRRHPCGSLRQDPSLRCTGERAVLRGEHGRELW